MTAGQVIDYIGMEMEKGAKTGDVYKSLYEKAYGHEITRELADTWVKSLEVSDGSDRGNGMKWSYEATTEAGNKIGIDWREVTKCEWYVVMNMMYSDYYRSAKYAEKQNDAMFFAHMAKDWIYDEDAPEDKLYRYYFAVIC